jgi:hypothetical protein
MVGDGVCREDSASGRVIGCVVKIPRGLVGMRLVMTPPSFGYELGSDGKSSILCEG